MGTLVNGARTFLRILAKACKLSHLPGFRIGLTNILGFEQIAAFYAVWTPLCELVDAYVEADNWYNQKDYQNTDGTGEDTNPPGVE
uniref:Uncharacterized protein n=1 Tax=uncultured prokaryote TaxID=198431 RepID=A0A0H5Q392_9ZZZZ|nr:hypothetical protein [uncultured prokaryote]